MSFFSLRNFLFFVIVYIFLTDNEKGKHYYNSWYGTRASKKSRSFFQDWNMIDTKNGDN